MKTEGNSVAIHFWMKWTLTSFGVIPLSYAISLIAVLLVHGAFGFSMTEGGTYLSQTLMQIAGGAVIGLGTGMYQRYLLKGTVNLPSSWIFASMLGFAGVELVTGIILWQMGLNRWELRWIEFKPLPEALIFAFAGLATGLMQWRILKRFFYRSGFWVVASTCGWGICILMTLFQRWSILAFCLGALLYGAITGAIVIWVMQGKSGVQG